MRNPIDFIWPMLDRPKATELAANEAKLANDVTNIKALAGIDDAVLEEARRLVDADEATRSGVELRGGIYLATIGALVPIVLFVAGSAATEPEFTWLLVTKIALALVASAYLIAAGAWALSSLGVRTYHRVGVLDVAEISKTTTEVRPRLTKALLESLRRNRDAINSKIDTIRMAQRFFWRAIIVLSALLVVAQVPEFLVHSGSKKAATCDVAPASVGYRATCNYE